MPGSEDIEIQISMELGKVLSDLKQLEQNVNATKKSIDGNLNPSVNNTSTRLTGLGNRVSETGNKIKQKLGTEAALAFTAAGTAALGFAKQCVDSAIKSESAWTRFGALVNSNGGNWDVEEGKIKKWASTHANAMGYAVSDTREASMALLQFGVQSKDLEKAMNGVAGVAARTGMTEAEASSMVISALNGRGMQLQKLTGLRIEDYKNADGQIDRERLLNDLYKNNEDAIKKHGDTTEAQIQRMNNSWGSFKKKIGDALLPVVKIIADVAGAIANGFANLPAPVQTFIAVLLLVGGAVGAFIGVLGLIAPALISIGGIITAIGEAGSIMGFLTPILGGLGGGFSVLLGAITPLIAPILAVVGAFVLLYAIGVKMGWWSDLSGMIAKFGDVLKQAGGAVMGFLGWFSKLFTDFPAAQEEFRNFVDGIRDQIINGLGQLGGMITEALGNAWNSVGESANDLKNALSDMFWNAVDGLRDTVMSTLGNIGGMITEALSNLGANVVPGGGLTEGILAIIAPLPTILYGLFMSMAPQVAPAVMAFINAILQRFGNIVLGVRNVFMRVVNAIRTRLSQARNIAGTLATAIRTAIVTRIQAVVTRVRTFFTTIVSTIRGRLTGAVGAARAKAVEIYHGIVDKIKGIPGQIRDEFGKLKDIIKQKLIDAAKAVFDGAKNVVKQFLSGLDRHSPGKIQRETLAEFSSLPGIIADSGVQSARATMNMARSIVGAWSDNMETLGVDVSEPDDVQFGTRISQEIIPQFRALSFEGFDYNIGRNDMSTVASNMRDITTSNVQNMSTSNTVNNDDHTVINNYSGDIHINLNELEKDEKERWWDMLNSIQPAGSI